MIWSIEQLTICLNCHQRDFSLINKLTLYKKGKRHLISIWNSSSWYMKQLKIQYYKDSLRLTQIIILITNMNQLMLNIIQLDGLPVNVVVYSLRWINIWRQGLCIYLRIRLDRMERILLRKMLIIILSSMKWDLMIIKSKN